MRRRVQTNNAAPTAGRPHSTFPTDSPRRRIRDDEGGASAADVYSTHLSRYRNLWNSLAATDRGAWYFSDGSSSENELSQRGSALASRIAHAIDVRKRHKVLEIGCGTARIGLPMSGLCSEWYGCDVSTRMISIARRRTQGVLNVHLELLKENSLSIFEADYFDRAYSVGVFCHLHKEDVFRYLCEVRRVLKPGGVFSCGMWNLCAEGGWQLWCNHVSSDDGVIPHTWTTPHEFERLINGAGLKIQALLTSKYLVEAIVSKGRSRARLRPLHLTDDESIFTDT